MAGRGRIDILFVPVLLFLINRFEASPLCHSVRCLDCCDQPPPNPLQLNREGEYIVMSLQFEIITGGGMVVC